MAAQLRIIVADDEPEILVYYQKVLPRMGYEVVALAKNGTELLEACNTHRPDLVVTDIRMPGIDGLDVIRQCVPGPLFITVSGQAKVDDETFEDRIAVQLTKPISRTDLAEAIDKAAKFLRSQGSSDHEERNPMGDISKEQKLALRAVMMPRDTNPYGTIFGGIILSYIDQAGAVGARQEIRAVGWRDKPLVTVAMNRVEFHEPILVGDVVGFLTRVLQVGRTSITMHVTVETERSGHSIKVTEAEVTYVAVAIDGSHRQPVPIRDDTNHTSS